MINGDWVIVVQPNDVPQFKSVKRNVYLTNKQDKIEEAKKIACSIIGAEYVDGVNLVIGNQYYGGVYCDDLAVSKYPKWGVLYIEQSVYELHGPIVIINEVGGLGISDCKEIKDYLIGHIVID